MSREIALQKIRQEAEEKTGFLDLGNLGLDAVPEELYQLTHLEHLILERVRWGDMHQWVDGKWKFANNEARQPNQIETLDARIQNLGNLQRLDV